MEALHELKARFNEPVRIEELAGIARLSPSAFHRQFKALTCMMPLQYQKQQRLLEARRLMVSITAGAETACFQVGYESPSQFSREYARMFGRPPKRDMMVMRTALTQNRMSIEEAVSVGLRPAADRRFSPPNAREGNRQFAQRLPDQRAIAAA